MTVDDCAKIIAAITTAQVAIIAALGALYVKVRATEATVRSNAKLLELAHPDLLAPGGGGPVSS